MLDSIIENTYDGVVVIDENHLYYANKAIIKMIGFTFEELKDRSPFSWIHASQKNRLGGLLKRKLAGGHDLPSRYDTTIVHKDGTPIPVEISSHVGVWGGNPVVEMIIRNEAERKKVERTLRESEQRYKTIVEDQVDVVSRFLPDGTFTFVNKACCKFFNMEKEKLLGQNFFSYLDADSGRRIKLFLINVSKSNSLTTQETKIETQDGSVRWFQWTIRGIFSERGKVQEFQCIGHEITALKQTEDALIKAERLAIVGSLATGIAHEYNEIHTGLLGFLELILSSDTGMSPSIRSRLETVYQKAQKSVELTKSLFSFTKIENFEKENIEAMIKKVINS